MGTGTIFAALIRSIHVAWDRENGCLSPLFISLIDGWWPMGRSIASVIALLCVLAAALVGAAPSWKNKPAAQWTEEEARQILTSSPWSRQITAGVARRLSEDELREAGQMGQPRTIGYDGVDPKGSGPKLPARPKDLVAPGPNGGRSLRSTTQAIALRLRWESALPVRLAELKSGELEPPTLEGDGYRIAVYGLPGGYFKGDPKKLGEPLKSEAVLRREGKRDAKPTRVEVFQRSDGWAVVYLFPTSVEISPKDKQIDFEAHIGRIVVLQPFDLADMTFQGKLEL
jgi:hypothetical protein